MDFNHISSRLADYQINELKNLYKTYHHKTCCYKKMFRRFKGISLFLNMLSVSLTVTRTVVGGVTLNPIVMGSVAGVGILIQTVLTKKNFTKKIEACKYAYTSYQKILNKLKCVLRSGEFDEDTLIKELNWLDDQVTDLCPPITVNYGKLFEKKK